MSGYITACEFQLHPLPPCAFMAAHPNTVAGDGNTVGNTLVNVGNRFFNISLFQRDNGSLSLFRALSML